MPKIVDEMVTSAIIMVFGEYMLSGIGLTLAASLFLAYKLFKKLREPNNKFPQLAKSALLICISFGVITFAGFLTIQMIIHQLVTSLAEKKIAQDRLSTEYAKQQVRTWLDQLGYSSHDQTKETDELFRLDVSGDMNFSLFQKNNKPDVLTMETHVSPKDNVLQKLSTLSRPSLDRVLIDMKLELVRLNIEVFMNTVYKGEQVAAHSVTLRNEFPYDPDRKVSFVRELFHLKSAKAAIFLYYEKVLKGLAS